MTTALTDSLRQSDLAALTTVLQEQKARAFDIVADAKAIKVDVGGTGAAIQLHGIEEPLLTEDGVTDVNGFYLPTRVANEGIAAKLDIPIGYLNRMFNRAPKLYQKNVEGWLEQDDRKFLLRLFRGLDSQEGVLRAFLSDQYRVIDNFDVLLAVLDGMSKAGIENPIIDADLTDRRMIVRVTVPEIAVYADKLLEGYRSPFDGTDVGRGWTPERLREVAEREGAGASEKLVFAGFVFSNSEVGAGAFSLTPRIVVQVCNNGLQLTAETIRKTHLGGKLEEGLVQWSEETLRSNLALVTNQTRDAVSTFLDVDFVTKQVQQLEEKAGEKVHQPQAVITNVSKALGFTENQANDILRHFIQGGQLTTGGVMQAVTSAVQEIRDGDVAHDMEAVAVRALDLAHRANKELARV